jgi:hypothetical protein
MTKRKPTSGGGRGVGGCRRLGFVSFGFFD